MDITPAIAKTRQLINRYHAGGFTVSGVDYSSAILLLPARVIPLDVQHIEQTNADLIPYLGNTELLLVGTGNEMCPVPQPLHMALKQQSIALEIMDTGAACRTYNILLSEDRRIAALLIPPK